ncbi:MAG: 50S ribosomal protein L31 [Patescibacteria group bacterium]
MKTDIHPKYFASAEIKCSCGHVIVVGSTKESMKTELCSKCHPFYTGQQKLVDTAGRVDKFMEKTKRSKTLKDAEVARNEAKKKKPEVYKEKEIPVEVLQKSGGMPEQPKGKWEGPVGDTPAEEVAKDAVAEAVAAKKTKAKATKKAPAAKKTAKKK